jgi:hypothetical protein
MAGIPFATNHASVLAATGSECDDLLTDLKGYGSIEVMALAIGHQKWDKPRGNFLLGNDDELIPAALNTRFGPGNQLVGSFGRHQDESKLAINTLWKVHL